MKKITVVAALAVALITAACTAADVEAQVTKVQALVVKGCGFVPAASAVATILTGGNPVVATVGGAADAICKAYRNTSPKPLTLFGMKPKEDCVVVVEGVCVPGEPVPQEVK